VRKRLRYGVPSHRKKVYMIRRLWLRWLCFHNIVCYTHGVAKTGVIYPLCPTCERELASLKNITNNSQMRTVARWRKEFEREEY
jgi:hypothetical protein